MTNKFGVLDIFWMFGNVYASLLVRSHHFWGSVCDNWLGVVFWCDFEPVVVPTCCMVLGLDIQRQVCCKLLVFTHCVLFGVGWPHNDRCVANRIMDTNTRDIVPWHTYNLDDIGIECHPIHIRRIDANAKSRSQIVDFFEPDRCKMFPPDVIGGFRMLFPKILCLSRFGQKSRSQIVSFLEMDGCKNHLLDVIGGNFQMQLMRLMAST